MPFNKDSLGLPGKGFHTHVFGVAILDLLGTALIAYLISSAVNQSFLLVFIIILIIGQLMHWYFGVQTTFTKALDKL